MKIEDIKLVTRAIEFMYYGVDINTVNDFSQFYNTSTHKFQTRTSPNVKHVTLMFDDECLEFMSHCYGAYAIRAGTNKTTFIRSAEYLSPEEAETVVKVDLEMLKQTMTILYRKDITRFEGIPVESFNEELVQELNKEDAEWDYSKKVHCKMMDTLTRDNTRQNLEVMLTMSDYNSEVARKVIEVFETDDVESFKNIKGYEDFEIIDNRLYIPLNRKDKLLFTNNESLNDNVKDTNYIVVSRNPYDFFFCSWGSAIQSCFSLNSPHLGGYGMYPFSSNKGCFIIYGTHGRGTEVALISGKKWKCPHMSWRCWGWLDTHGKIRMDRLYPVLNDNRDFDAAYRQTYPLFDKLFGYSFDDNHKCMTQPLMYTDDYETFINTYKLYFYPDSINRAAEYKGVCNGVRDFIGTNKPKKTLYDALRSIKEVDTGFKYTDRYFISPLGVLSALKICPVTQVPIPNSLDKSFYSKFFKEPVSGLVVMTYCDGHIKLDDSSVKTMTGYFTLQTERVGAGNSEFSSSSNVIVLTPKWSYNLYNLKVLKDWIKQNIKHLKTDCLLLRTIEEDRVQYIKYRR